jgi:GT2 family glycosyltransferase
MNVLLVPTLALDVSLLDRFVQSLDYRIKYKVVINNGIYGSLDEWSKRHPDWEVLDQISNLGVAASWNMAPLVAPYEKCWLICNDDCAFVPGDLKKVCECADKYAESEPIITMHDDGYWAFVWTAVGLKEFGKFDENYYPGYYEDYDMKQRHKQASKWPYRIALGPEPRTHHGKPKTGGPRWNAMVRACSPYIVDYYRRKWGPNSDWKHPFNDPSRPLSYWELERENRIRVEDIWRKFITSPNPSIYT